MDPELVVEADDTKGEIEMNKKVYCKNCGKELPADQRFCDKCGTKVTLPAAPASDAVQPIGSAGKKNNKKIAIAVVAVMAVVIVGIATFSLLHKTTLDISDTYKVEFYGYDGSGSFEVIGETDQVYSLVESENELAYELAETIDYNKANNSNKQGKLKNGDKLKIKIGYSEDAADRAQIKLEGAEKEVTVKGLTERYKNADELDKDMIKKMTSQANVTAKEEAENTWDSGAKSKLVKRYYLYDKYTESAGSDEDENDNYYDTVLFVYEISGIDYFSEKRDFTYCYVAVCPVNGSYREGDYGDCISTESCSLEKPTFDKFISELKRENQFPDSKYVWSEIKE